MNYLRVILNPTTHHIIINNHENDNINLIGRIQKTIHWQVIHPITKSWMWLFTYPPFRNFIITQMVTIRVYPLLMKDRGVILV